MLVTVSCILVSNINYLLRLASGTNIQTMPPTSKFCHQHPKLASRCHQYHCHLSNKDTTAISSEKPPTQAFSGILYNILYQIQSTSRNSFDAHFKFKAPTSSNFFMDSAITEETTKLEQRALEKFISSARGRYQKFECLKDIKVVGRRKLISFTSRFEI